ncbi:hypothetical protein Tco_0879942 [Tanacetum coccineum]
MIHFSSFCLCSLDIHSAILAYTQAGWFKGQVQVLWHTLKLDGSKDKFKFFLDTKEFKLSIDDFKRIFQFPQATDNNNDGFVAAPSFSAMLPFFLDDLRFSLLMHLPSHFVSKRISQPWHTLVKIFTRCLSWERPECDAHSGKTGSHCVLTDFIDFVEMTTSVAYESFRHTKMAE